VSYPSRLLTGVRNFPVALVPTCGQFGLTTNLDPEGSDWLPRIELLAINLKALDRSINKLYQSDWLDVTNIAPTFFLVSPLLSQVAFITV
jgi:hypothetical protein